MCRPATRAVLLSAVIAVFILVCGRAGAASETLWLNSSIHATPLGAALSAWRVDRTQADIESALAAFEAGDFVPVDGPPDFGMTVDGVWLHAAIGNAGERPGRGGVGHRTQFAAFIGRVGSSHRRHLPRCRIAVGVRHRRQRQACCPEGPASTGAAARARSQRAPSRRARRRVTRTSRHKGPWRRRHRRRRGCCSLPTLTAATPGISVTTSLVL